MNGFLLQWPSVGIGAAAGAALLWLLTHFFAPYIRDRLNLAGHDRNARAREERLNRDRDLPPRRQLGERLRLFAHMLESGAPYGLRENVDKWETHCSAIAGLLSDDRTILALGSHFNVISGRLVDIRIRMSGERSERPRDRDDYERTASCYENTRAALISVQIMLETVGKLDWRLSDLRQEAEVAKQRAAQWMWKIDEQRQLGLRSKDLPPPLPPDPKAIRCLISPYGPDVAPSRAPITPFDQKAIDAISRSIKRNDLRIQPPTADPMDEE